MLINYVDVHLSARREFSIYSIRIYISIFFAPRQSLSNGK